MPIKVNFENLYTCNNISGYRISTRLHPESGFQGNFFVYVLEVIEVSQNFNHVDLLTKGTDPQGTLIIQGENRTYKFEKIYLTSMEAGVTRRERYRLLEFRYKGESDISVPADLQNDGTYELKASGLKEDYKYAIGDEQEYLLGFRTLQRSERTALFRFSSIRNKKNSWSAKAVQLSKAMAEEGQVMPEFIVNFTQNPIRVTKDTLANLWVVESYGELTRVALPPLQDLISKDGNPPRFQEINMRMDDFTQLELYQHDTSGGFSSQVCTRTIETATIEVMVGHVNEVKVI